MSVTRRNLLTNKFAVGLLGYFIHRENCGRAVYGVGLWQLACWLGGFESRRRHSCQSRLVYILMYRSLLWADHSFRGVLPHVSVSQTVMSKSLQWGSLGPLWLPNHKKLLFYYIWTPWRWRNKFWLLLNLYWFNKKHTADT